MAEAGLKGTAARARPLSPHMQVWRWHVTMAASSLTRATGIALYGGALAATLWFTTLMIGPDLFNPYVALLGSPLGKIALFGITFSVFYHLAAGLRHLAFDVGLGFSPRMASLTAVAAMAFAIVASLMVWFIAWRTGGLS